MSRPKRTTPWLARRGNPNNGVFYAYWYNEEKRAVDKLSLATSDSVEAEIKFAEFLLNGREIRVPRPLGLTVGATLDDYLTEHVDKHCADGARQRDAVAHLKEFFGENRPIGDVNVPLSREYAKARIDGVIGGGKRRKVKTAAPSTVRRELNVLVAAANHAVWMKRTKETVAVDLPPEKRLGPDDEAPYYTHEELDKIFAEAEAIGGELNLFVKLLYYTGARRRSIQDLTRSQVKMRERRILLQRPGKKTTKKRQPIVPIFRSMVQDVEMLLMLTDKDRLFEAADFYRPYRDLCEKVGIDEERRHPHVMRHTRATHLLQDGKSIYDVAKLLGDTIATVERVYGHHSHSHLAEKLEG